MSNPVKLADDRWLVQTACHECFLDVEWSTASDWKWIEVSLLSTHQGWWNGRFRSKLREAWNILHGRGYTWIEMMEADEVDALISALAIARAEVFGTSEPVAEVAV